MEESAETAEPVVMAEARVGPEVMVAREEMGAQEEAEDLAEPVAQDWVVQSTTKERCF